MAEAEAEDTDKLENICKDKQQDSYPETTDLETRAV